jgi:hypothetical protein
MERQGPSQGGDDFARETSIDEDQQSVQASVKSQSHGHPRQDLHRRGISEPALVRLSSLYSLDEEGNEVGRAIPEDGCYADRDDVSKESCELSDSISSFSKPTATNITDGQIQTVFSLSEPKSNAVDLSPTSCLNNSNTILSNANTNTNIPTFTVDISSYRIEDIVESKPNADTSANVARNSSVLSLDRTSLIIDTSKSLRTSQNEGVGFFRRESLQTSSALSRNTSASPFTASSYSYPHSAISIRSGGSIVLEKDIHPILDRALLDLDFGTFWQWAICICIVTFDLELGQGR